MSVSPGRWVRLTLFAGGVVLVVGAVVVLIPSRDGARPNVAPPSPCLELSAVPVASPGTSVRVSSIAGLLDTLADDSVTDIVVANGTYRVSAASSQASDSLWIGVRYASRTRPVTVRAETRCGVTFDGGGANMGGLTFTGGAHHQTWDGFNFANGVTNQTGVIVFGGYAGQNAPHDITLRNITVLASCHRAAAANTTTDHAVYFSYALDTWGGILIDNLTVEATDAAALSSGIHMDHGYTSDAPNVAAHGVTVGT